MKKVIREGEEVPRFYGVAYLAPNAFAYVCYPIGIHWLANLWRRVYAWVLVSAVEKSEFLGYNKGYEEGRKYAFNQYKQQAVKEEVGTIVRNTIDLYSNVFMNREKTDEELRGWIWKHIEKETKRITKSNRV